MVITDDSIAFLRYKVKKVAMKVHNKQRQTDSQPSTLSAAALDVMPKRI
jgi:hypothetical protein